MPHLSEIAERHRHLGLVVIGVNLMEDDLEVVRLFARENASRMRYASAYDHSGTVEADWMTAAGLAGLPASFVVDRRGVIAWVGHPAQLGPVVEQVVHGTWDLVVARDRARRQRLTLPFARRFLELIGGAQTERGYRVGRAVVELLIYDDPELLGALANHVLTSNDVAVRDLRFASHAVHVAGEYTDWGDPGLITLRDRILAAQSSGCSRPQ